MSSDIERAPREVTALKAFSKSGLDTGVPARADAVTEPELCPLEVPDGEFDGAEGRGVLDDEPAEDDADVPGGRITELMALRMPEIGSGPGGAELGLVSTPPGEQRTSETSRRFPREDKALERRMRERPSDFMSKVNDACSSSVNEVVDRRSRRLSSKPRVLEVSRDIRPNVFRSSATDSFFSSSGAG